MSIPYLKMSIGFVMWIHPLNSRYAEGRMKELLEEWLIFFWL